MAWERFSYICRQLSAQQQAQQNLASDIRIYKQAETSQLYGNTPQAGSWAHRLLCQLGELSDPEQAASALAIYRRIDLSQQLYEPLQFKRSLAYFSLVGVVFYLVASIYHLFVMPSFMQSFDSFGITPPPTVRFYQQHWLSMVLTLSVLLLLSWLSALNLQSLFSLPIKREQSFVYRCLVLPAIRRCYRRIGTLLQFPLLKVGEPHPAADPLLLQHLQELQGSTLNLGEEIQSLLNIECRRLSALCDKQLRILSALVASTVISAIFLLLVSAYSPLFIIGETL